MRDVCSRSGKVKSERLLEAHGVNLRLPTRNERRLTRQCLLPLCNSMSIVQSTGRLHFSTKEVKSLGPRCPHNCQLIHTFLPTKKLFI
jgi:hypothetical protein